MAALKRAQAHQRRGCPEQQQQPLLAVKVELEQLIISILDDPSVSRVMREASFSSPAVKATIEQSLSSTATVNQSSIGLGFRPAPPNGRNLYLNPRLQQGGTPQMGSNQRGEEVKKVIDILLRNRKRNPVLVGESEPDLVMKELLSKIKKRELGEQELTNVEVIPMEKELVLDRNQILERIKKLGDSIESELGELNCGGIIVDLGDLKWLVEQPTGASLGGAGLSAGSMQQQQLMLETGRAAMAEMGKLLAKFVERKNGRVWLIGTATCETYLRCLVYHPTMENEWDLQAVPIAARAPLPGLFPRLGSSGILSSSVESLSPLKNFPTALPKRLSENLDPSRRMSCCPECLQTYEQELAKLMVKESDKSSSDAKPPLPQWLQNARPNNNASTDLRQTKDQELIMKEKTQDLQKKWSNICLNLHPDFHHLNLSSEKIVPTALVMTDLYNSNPNSNLLGRQPFQPKLQLQLNSNPIPKPQSEQASSPPGSPVRTELVLGRPKIAQTSLEETHRERIKDFLGCISSDQTNKKFDELIVDTDAFKKLLKGLTEKVWWQREAASAVAQTVTRCKSGRGKSRVIGQKGDIWLLFTGCDRVGKKKVGSVLSELVCGADPFVVGLGSQRDNSNKEFNLNSRGKTALDRIVEAVRRNPFSVIILEDVDEADMILRGNIKRAIERGRIVDSHGREVGLGNVIFILTVNHLSGDSIKPSYEEKLSTVANGSWQLKLSVSEKTSKRRASWVKDEEDRAIRMRMESEPTISFDLNQAADVEDDRADGSRNSSDLTVDHEDEHHLSNSLSPVGLIPREFLDSVDEAIMFKPVDFGAIRAQIVDSINSKFLDVMGGRHSIELEDEAVEKILGSVWLGKDGIKDWAERVVVPSFSELKMKLPAITNSGQAVVVRLEADSGGLSDSRNDGDWLPRKIRVAVDGL